MPYAVCYQIAQKTNLANLYSLFTIQIIASTVTINIKNRVSNDTGQHHGSAYLHRQGSKHIEVIVHHISYHIHRDLEFLVVAFSGQLLRSNLMSGRDQY
jgi:hypothetical protein